MMELRALLDYNSQRDSFPVLKNRREPAPTRLGEEASFPLTVLLNR